MKGLRNCGTSPQEYALSALLYSYGKVGIRNITKETVKISVKDESIADGSWDVKVPKRITKGFNPFRNIKLAFLVLFGQADVLYYR